LHEIMGFLSHHFVGIKHKEGTKVIDYVRAMASTHDRYKQATAKRRALAERNVREANELIVALRFVSKASKNGSSGLSVGGASLAIGIDQLLSVAIDKIQLLIASDRGLLDGNQADSEVDPLSVLWQDPVAR